MKKYLLLVLMTGTLAATETTQAQISLNIRIGSPAWGVPGVSRADYYFLPDIDAFYDLRGRQFVYLDRGRWCFSNALPGWHRGFDLFGARKIIINEPNPWSRYDFYHRRYAPPVMVYRDRDDWRHDRGRHNGWYDNDRRDRRDKHDHGRNRRWDRD